MVEASVSLSLSFLCSWVDDWGFLSRRLSLGLGNTIHVQQQQHWLLRMQTLACMVVARAKRQRRRRHAPAKVASSHILARALSLACQLPSILYTEGPIILFILFFPGSTKLTKLMSVRNSPLTRLFPSILFFCHWTFPAACLSSSWFLSKLEVKLALCMDYFYLSTHVISTILTQILSIAQIHRKTI